MGLYRVCYKITVKISIFQLLHVNKKRGMFEIVSRIVPIHSQEYLSFLAMLVQDVNVMEWLRVKTKVLEVNTP